MRILVIDDDDVVREMICRMLTDVGHEVTQARDGKEGLRIVAKEADIGMVISDLIMPEKEGIETIREIRGDHPEMKILAISGGGAGGAQAYLSLAGKIGADATLKKPFVSDELLSVVRDLVGN